MQNAAWSAPVELDQRSVGRAARIDAMQMDAMSQSVQRRRAARRILQARHGAIPGLLPHGPHNIRDVLATHILKRTGSYEQASYAIQDTPDMVAQHYGRFLPQDKAALAARILNQVWEAA
jgi:hypothetical protein